MVKKKKKKKNKKEKKKLGFGSPSPQTLLWLTLTCSHRKQLGLSQATSTISGMVVRSPSCLAHGGLHHWKPPLGQLLGPARQWNNTIARPCIFSRLPLEIPKCAICHLAGDI